MDEPADWKDSDNAQLRPGEGRTLELLFKLSRHNATPLTGDNATPVYAKNMDFLFMTCYEMSVTLDSYSKSNIFQ